MPNSVSKTTSRLAREIRGQEIAEAALVLPIVFMLMLGIFWFGQAFSIYGTITHAAREGARAAVAPVCATCGTPLDSTTVAQNAVNALQNALLAAKLDPAQSKKYPVTPPALISCIDGIAAKCDGTQLTNAGVCVQDNVQLSGVNSTGLAGCGVSVTFQYPYQFWLPFTSLNKQLIFVPAQARMKMESR
jgi:Flp pilus assembly protein TadG